MDTNFDAIEKQERKNLAMGRKLGRIFKDRDEVGLDSFTVTRKKELRDYPSRGGRKEVNTYVFTEIPDHSRDAFDGDSAGEPTSPGFQTTDGEVLEKRAPLPVDEKNGLPGPINGGSGPIEGLMEDSSGPIGPIGSENFLNEKSVCYAYSKKDCASISPISPIRTEMASDKTQPFVGLALSFCSIPTHVPEKESAVRYINGPAYCPFSLSVCHPDGRCEQRRDIAVALGELKAVYGKSLELATVIVYNATLQVLALQRYGAAPKRVLDISSLARLFQHKDAPRSLEALALRYGLRRDVNDAELIQRLALKMLEAGIPQSELDLVDHSARMPLHKYVRIDSPKAMKGLNILKQHISRAFENAGLPEKDISGNISFNKLVNKTFSDEGLQPPIENLSQAPDKTFLAKLENSALPRARTLAELRRLLDTTRSIRSQLKHIIDIGPLTTGFMPVFLEYHNTVTGRFTGGGDGFNFHGIPSPNRYDGVLKEAVESIGGSLTPPKGHKFVSSDASQIEARLLAHTAGQKDLSQAFADGRDIYSEFATSVFGEPAGKAEGDSPEATRMMMLRKIGKTAILGLGYQMGADLLYKKFQETKELAPLLDDGTITRKRCGDIVDAYRQKYPAIVAFWHGAEKAFVEVVERQSQALVRLGTLTLQKADDAVHIELPSGRRIIYPDVKVCNGKICSGKDNNLYGGKLVENIIQAIARDLLANAILTLEKQGWPVVCHIHDEIICLAPEQRAEECLEAMINAWRAIPEWATGLILDAEGRIGNNFVEI